MKGFCNGTKSRKSYLQKKKSNIKLDIVLIGTLFFQSFLFSENGNTLAKVSPKIRRPLYLVDIIYSST